MTSKQTNMEKRIDPGWNDPPMLNYGPSNPPPKSRITNKRVAFPLGSNNTIAQSSNPQSLPPSLPPTSTLPPAPREENLLKGIKENFETLLLNNSDPIMKKSTQLLYERWEEGIFTRDCEENIYLLTKFLVENNKSRAQHIKEKLLTEFKDSCEDWLAVIVI